MASSVAPEPNLEANIPKQLDPIAGVLSFLLPGMGQIVQGRIGKGLLFFFGIYALFFYGMALGQWTNVYLPTTDRAPNGTIVSRVMNDLYARPHFAGQFFMGLAIWPAVQQYRNYDERNEVGPTFGRYMRAPGEEEIRRRQRETNKTWDLGWVFTVIAGVLNILVIYDAIAGPAFREVLPKPTDPKPTPPPTPEPLPS